MMAFSGCLGDDDDSSSSGGNGGGMNAPSQLSVGDVIKVYEDSDPLVFTITGSSSLSKTGGHFGSQVFSGTYTYQTTSDVTAEFNVAVTASDNHDMILNFNSGQTHLKIYYGSTVYEDDNYSFDYIQGN
ncbi:hypothetical protein [Pontiella desulfatans]|nr:hypothetical protein [Pontiella desulfatans]